MKIIVTGSEGNVGSVLVPYLKQCGHEVFGIDIKQNYKDNFITADINNVSDLLTAFGQMPDLVIHMAAMVSRVTCELSPAITLQTNVVGTMNIIQLCKTFGARLMFFSTSEVYGNNFGIELNESLKPNPNNVYGYSKYIGEQIVEHEIKNGLKALIVRPFMFYHESETTGDHRSAMIRFVNDLLISKPITVHEGSARSWLHLDDGVKIIEKLCYVKDFHIVNVGHPELIQTIDLANKIRELLGQPEDLIKVKSLPGKMTLIKNPSLDMMFKLTGYKPVINIDEGIKRIIVNTLKSCV